MESCGALGRTATVACCYFPSLFTNAAAPDQILYFLALGLSHFLSHNTGSDPNPSLREDYFHDKYSFGAAAYIAACEDHKFCDRGTDQKASVGPFPSQCLLAMVLHTPRC